MSRLEISRAGLDLIESFEGFRAKAARLPNGNFTIGFGHTMTARDGMVVNREQAEELLKWDLGPIQDFVRQNALTNLTQNQFDALASFVFNIGIENFKTSDVLRHLNQGEPISAAIAMTAWRRAHINGKQIVVDALVRRRTLEAAMFLDTSGPRPAAPSPIVKPYLDYSAALLAPKPETIKAVSFEKASSTPILTQAVQDEAPEQEQIFGDEIVSNAQKDEIVGEMLKDEPKDFGGEVLQFPNIDNETAIIETKASAPIEVAPANVAKIIEEKPANDGENKIRVVAPAIAAAAASAKVVEPSISKPAKSTKSFDLFTIYVVLIGLVAFIASLYEALGQGMFNNGFKSAISNPNNIFVLLTMVVGAITSAFGLFSLFFEETDAQ